MNMSFQQTAIVYAERFGLSIFPCRASGKEPLTQHGCKDACRNPHQLHDWWSRWPNANIGVACGAVSSGLLVLDVDGDEGLQSLQELERTHGPIRAAQTITGKGYQYWFHSEQPFKNRVRLLPGLDIRSDGGYVIAPPSKHPNGKNYVWEISSPLEDVGLQPVPAWLTQLLADEGQGSSTPTRGHGSAFWRKLMTEGVREGGRNNAITQLAGHLLRRGIDHYVVLELCQAFNTRSVIQPIPEDEVYRIVNSVLGMEMKRRKRGFYG